jgi:hypothetical protein
MRYRGTIDLHAHPIVAIAPVIDAVFGAFGKLALVAAADQDSLSLPLAHVGGPAFRATLFAALSRELGVQAPGRYTVEPIELAGPGARIRISLMKGETP